MCPTINTQFWLKKESGISCYRPRTTSPDMLIAKDRNKILITLKFSLTALSKTEHTWGIHTSIFPECLRVASCTAAVLNFRRSGRFSRVFHPCIPDSWCHVFYALLRFPPLPFWPCSPFLLPGLPRFQSPHIYNDFVRIKWVKLTCRYSQPGTSANRAGMYEYISHSFMSTFTLKPLQSTTPVHCMPHWATSGKPPTPVRLTTLVGSSTAHVHFSSGIVNTGMNDFGELPVDMSQ